LKLPVEYICITYRYAAPECIEKKKDFSPTEKSDVYRYFLYLIACAIHFQLLNLIVVVSFFFNCPFLY